MVVSCSARGCKNRGGQFDENGVKIGWHRFPHRDQVLLARWTQAMDRVGWKPNESSHVCSVHFLAADYVFCPGAKAKRLKPDTVPTVFKSATAGQRLVKRRTHPVPPQPPPPPQPTLPSSAPSGDEETEIEPQDYLIPEVEYSLTDSGTLTFEQPPPTQQSTTTAASESGEPRTYSKKPADAALQLREQPASKLHKPNKPKLGRPTPTMPVATNTTTAAPRRVYFKRPTAPRPYTQPLTIHRKVAIEHDHQYSQDNFLSTSNRSDVYVTKLEESVRKLTADLVQLKKDNVLLKQAAHRRARLVATLNRRIADLAHTVNQQQQATGAENLSRLMQMLLDNGQRNAARVAQGRQYSREMRQFCRTVHHFSPPAYRFLKEQLYLPDPRSLRKWASEGSSVAATASTEAPQPPTPPPAEETTRTELVPVVVAANPSVAPPSAAPTNKDYGGSFAEIDFSHLEDGPDETLTTSGREVDFTGMGGGVGNGVVSGGGGRLTDSVDGCAEMETMGMDRGDAVTSLREVTDVRDGAGSVLDFSHLEDDVLGGAGGQVVTLPDFCRITM